MNGLVLGCIVMVNIFGFVLFGRMTATSLSKCTLYKNEWHALKSKQNFQTVYNSSLFSGCSKQVQLGASFNQLTSQLEKRKGVEETRFEPCGFVHQRC